MYKDAVRYLDSLSDHEKTGLDCLKGRYDLGKLKRILSRMGDPQDDFRSVHIAGTKGKGSVSVFVSSILREAGLDVGLFTSPHLADPRERISVNGSMISEAELESSVSLLKEALSGEVISFFEAYTLIALEHFSRKKVDFAVLECGLGGRLDATNVVGAEVCGIAPISYDHMQVLGTKIEEIAGEKAAIIKKGSVCVSSPQRSEVMRVISEKCRKEEAPLSVTGKDTTYFLKEAGEQGSVFDIKGKKADYIGCRTVMPGAFQVENAATAIGIIENIKGDVLGDSSLAPREVVKSGILKAFLPGRMEILCREPLFVIDGAQNAESASRLKYSVEEIFKYDRLILLLGLSADKDIRGVCRELVPLADEIVLTKAQVARAADPHIIRGYIRAGKVRIARDVKESLGIVFGLAGKTDMVLAAGSFYLIGEIRNELQKRR